MPLTDEMRAEGWIEHDGGRQPCGRKHQVSAMFRNGLVRRGRNPLAIPWEHAKIGARYPELHIIAYRLEQENRRG